MDRRGFLQRLGLGAGAAAVATISAPAIVAQLEAVTPTTEVSHLGGHAGEIVKWNPVEDSTPFPQWEFIFSSNKAIESRPDSWFDAHRRHYAHLPTGRVPAPKAHFDGREHERVAYDEATRRAWYVAFNN